MPAIYRPIALAAILLLFTGCTMIAPNYSPSIDNLQTLKEADIQAAKTGTFSQTAGEDNGNPISMRGNRLKSPYGKSYGDYLAKALELELLVAKKYSPDANTEISGELLKNDIDVRGASVGTGIIEARFVVIRAGKVRYEQIKSARSEWPSSFVGGIALPRGRDAYPQLVQKLLAELFSDPAFLDALK